jgi:hypothetical protein
MSRSSSCRPDAQESADEVAFGAALNFIRDGYPGVDMCDDPDDYVGARRHALLKHVKAALIKAGHDPDWDEVFDAIWEAEGKADTATMVAYNGGGNSEELAIARSFASRPAPMPAPVKLDCGARVRRGRAPRHRRGNHHPRGGRRRTGQDPGDPAGDPDPLGIGLPPAPREHAGVTP